MPILAGFAFGGNSAPVVDHTIPVAPSSNGTYTVSGTLTDTFTTSGTYTPGAGVSKVNVVVIGGGGKGGSGTSNGSGCGGAGGAVRVYNNVPVTGSVSVTVGGSETASSFGALSAPAGPSAANGSLWPGRSAGLNYGASAGGGAGFHLSGAGQGGGEAGQNGVTINGTVYAGGGGGGAYSSAGLGGSGGGGKARTYQGVAGTAGTNGLGGGGGGGGGNTAGYNGGTGRVMVFTAI